MQNDKLRVPETDIMNYAKAVPKTYEDLRELYVVCYGYYGNNKSAWLQTIHIAELSEMFGLTIGEMFRQLIGDDYPIKAGGKR